MHRGLIYLAEGPDPLIWILVAIVWAVAQLFGKVANQRARAAARKEQEGNRKAPTGRANRSPRELRPVSGPDPISPTEELRRFLREITGQPAEETPAAAAQTVRPAVSDHPPGRPPQSRPRRPSRMPARKPPLAGAIASGRLRSETQAATGLPGRQKKGARFPGNLRQAVLHREILGPPRAMRPHSFEYH